MTRRRTQIGTISSSSHPNASFFHSAAWARVLCKTYGHEPNCLLLSKDAEPVALVPLLEVSSPLTGRRGVCLPFTDFCDPLLFRGCDSSMASKLLCEFACSRKWNHLASRLLTTTANGAQITCSLEGVDIYGDTVDLPRLPKRFFGAAGLA